MKVKIKPGAPKPPKIPAEPKPPNKSKGTGHPINWMKVKTAFLAKNLDPAATHPYTLQDCANEFGLGYAHLTSVAKKQGWKKELAKQATIVTNQAIENIVSDAIETEGQIRVRQATLARLAQEKAHEALKVLDPELMEPRDIIQMTRVGLMEERKALGFADRIEFDDLSKDKTDDYESPMEKAAKAKALNALSDRLLKKLGKNA